MSSLKDLALDVLRAEAAVAHWERGLEEARMARGGAKGRLVGHLRMRQDAGEDVSLPLVIRTREGAVAVRVSGKIPERPNYGGFDRDKWIVESVGEFANITVIDATDE